MKRGASGRVVAGLATGAASLLLSVSPDAFSQTSERDLADERAAISAQRSVAQADFDRRLAACHKVFLTTACVDKVNDDWRHARTQLNARQAAIDQIERRQKAAQRLDALEQRQREQAERARSGAARAASAGLTASPADDEAFLRGERPHDAAPGAGDAASMLAPLSPRATGMPTPSGSKDIAPPAGDHAASASDKAGRPLCERQPAGCPAGSQRSMQGCITAQEAAADAAAQQRRRAEAEAHKRDVLRRNAERDSSKKAKALPVPSGIPPR